VADAQKAKVQAQYAEKVEIAGLNKTNWDISNLRSQISDRSARLNLTLKRLRQMLPTRCPAFKRI
jgi:hypothetical protein